MALEINAVNFEQEVIKSDLPVLVDFWAAWCGPCRMVGPVIEELAKEYEGKLKVCKVNVDEASEVASKFGVMSIPTLIVFNKGEVAAQTVGAMSKEKLIGFVTPYLK
ncbi:MAG: thioredoxin [Candidatus Omnitrophota bacterium]